MQVLKEDKEHRNHIQQSRRTYQQPFVKVIYIPTTYPDGRQKDKHVGHPAETQKKFYVNTVLPDNICKRTVKTEMPITTINMEITPARTGRSINVFTVIFYTPFG